MRFSLSLGIWRQHFGLCKKSNVSSKLWLERHVKDPFVKQALVDGYRARSAYKLIEIDKKFKILRPGMAVVECGAAPGAWTQVVADKIIHTKNKCSQNSIVIGCDLLAIEPIDGAHLLSRKDFTHSSTQELILSILKGRKIDLVLSDMAPNASGQKSLDSASITLLAAQAFRFALLNSEVGGSFVVKLWKGPDTQRFFNEVSSFYNNVKVIKPQSSRKESSETFIVATGFKGIVKKSSK